MLQKCLFLLQTSKGVSRKSSDAEAVDISGCICHPTSLFLIFRVGGPRGGFLPGRSSFAIEKLARLMKGPGISCQLGASMQPHGQRQPPTRHCGLMLHLQTSFSSTPKSLLATGSALGLQTVDNSTQRTYSLYHPPKCCWSSVAAGKWERCWVTSCTHMHAHMEWQLLFWPSWWKARSLVSSFIAAKHLFLLQTGFRMQPAAPQLPCRLHLDPNANPGHAFGAVPDRSNWTHLRGHSVTIIIYLSLQMCHLGRSELHELPPMNCSGRVEVGQPFPWARTAKDIICKQE